MWGRRSLKRRKVEPQSPIHSWDCKGTDADVQWMKQELILDPSCVHSSNKRNLGSPPPLVTSVCMGHYECAKILINNNANINEDSYYGKTPLFYALHKNKLDILKLLLDAKVELNYKFKDTDFVPLVFVIVSGNVEAVQLLLKYGADPNIINALTFINTSQHSCLSVALINGNKKIVKLLLEHDASLTDSITTDEKLLHNVLRTVLFGHVDCLKQLFLFGAWHMLKSEPFLADRQLQYQCPRKVVVFVTAIFSSECDKYTKMNLVELFYQIGLNYWTFDANNPESWEIFRLEMQAADVLDTEELVDHVKQVRSEILSLKSLCRLSIHDHLGTDYAKRIKKFDIPKTLVPFLEYEE